jgi:hypothetical protein
MTLRMRIDGKFKLRDVFQGVVVIGRRIRSGERTASERGARADLGKRCLLALKWVVIDTCHRSLTLLPICFPLLDFTKSSKLSPLPYSVCACELCSVNIAAYLPPYLREWSTCHGRFHFESSTTRENASPKAETGAPLLCSDLPPRRKSVHCRISRPTVKSVLVTA